MNLYQYFQVTSINDGKEKMEFSGQLVKISNNKTNQSNGTKVVFIPDDEIFENYRFYSEYIEKSLWNYAYLNRGLTIIFNGQKFIAKNGLYDLLNNVINGEIAYPIIHLQEKEFELAFTHFERGSGEEYYTFVNGQHTIHGGTHQQALREAS